MENGKFVDSCLVHVVCDIDTVTLNKNQATIELGRTITLTPTVKVKPTVENPEEVDQTVYWKSDNKEIAVASEVDPPSKVAFASAHINRTSA